MMDSRVICIGTMWDLDRVVYPELDDLTGRGGRSFHYLAEFQLTSSSLLKKVTQDGKRICTHRHCQVEALDKCRHWLMAVALQGIGK